jgi:hypothetical protein
MRLFLGIAVLLWTLSGCTRQVVKRDPAGPPAPAVGATSAQGAPANSAPLQTASTPVQRKTDRGQATPPTDVGEQRAIAIAKRAVALDHGWVDRVSFAAKRDGDGWFVFVQRTSGQRGSGQPASVPGAHRLLVIDRTGRVVNDVPGTAAPG